MSEPKVIDGEVVDAPRVLAAEPAEQVRLRCDKVVERAAGINEADEEWRPIPGFEGYYEISSLGRVFSHPRARTKGGIRKSHPAKRGGYPQISLYGGEGERTFQIHWLVAAAFIGPRAPDMEVRHLDGNPLNCSAKNLAYGTRSDNVKDSIAHGTHVNTRKIHCPRGHRYDEANTRIYRTSRYCRTCTKRRRNQCA